MKKLINLNRNSTLIFLLANNSLYSYPLRDEAVQKLSSVENLLGYFLRSQSWKQEAIQTIIDSSGKNACAHYFRRL